MTILLKKPFFFIYFLLFIAHCSLFTVKAQTQLRMVPCGSPSSCKKNTIFHETNTNLKDFNYNSLNFEHLLLCRPANNIGLRIGVEYITFPKIKAYGVPLGINFMFGRSYNQFEAGFGATYMHFNKDYDASVGQFDVDLSYVGLNGNLGFRHQNADGGLFYRLGFTPMLSIINGDKISVIKDRSLIMMAGISIGWTFK